MKKIKILVFEDNKMDIAILEDSLVNENFEITGITCNLDDAIRLYQTLDFDIVIIDIFINNQPLGIRFAEIINASPISKPFVFLTSSIDKSIFNMAKTVDPYNYLIKPFNRSELLFAIELSLENFLQKESAFINQQPVFYNEAFFVKEGTSLVKIGLDEIKFITIDGSYCCIITQKGDFIIQTSLSRIMHELPKNMFLRSHRNFIVNIKKIEKIYLNDNLILMSSGEKILLSRRNKEDLFKKYKLLR